MKKSLNPHEVYVQRRRTYIQRRQTKLSYPKKIYRCPKKFTYRWQYGIHSPWWSQGYSIGLLKRLIVFTFNNIWKREASFTASILVPVFVKSVIYHKKIEWYLVITYNIPNFTIDKSCLTSKRMHIAEIRTVAKSLPPLRWNTHKSIILSYSADFSVIFLKNAKCYVGNATQKGK